MNLPGLRYHRGSVWYEKSLKEWEAKEENQKRGK